MAKKKTTSKRILRPKIHEHDMEFIEDRTTFNAVRWALSLIDKKDEPPVKACKVAAGYFHVELPEVRYYVFQALYRRQDRRLAGRG